MFAGSRLAAGGKRRMESPHSHSKQGKSMYQITLRAGEIAHSRDRLPLTVTMENDSNSGFNDPR